MIVELGHYALILALAVALIQGVVPMLGAQRRDAAFMEVARTGALAQFVLIALSFGSLMYAHATSDFSVANVVANSHSSKPMLYKLAGTWGNHEGSMLLWVLILAIFGAAVAAFGVNLPQALRARVLAVQSWIAIAFYLFIIFTSDPFTRMIPAPLDGAGLNPLLQDPGLAFHPPFLYLGYVGFSMAFSFAIAALIEGRVDAAWARWVRPWTLAAWMFLTVGITLGSWWAYYELGWGGWWFWDPVENASLMPWLAGTALLHSASVVEKRDALKGWTIFLAIVTFGLSLLGTFLVRSGVLTSVHAFAVDPARGIFILGLLVVIIGGSLALFAWRGPALQGGGLFQPISREGALLLNNLLLATAAASVLLGTLYPLMLEAVGGDKVSVGPPFFNAVFIPLMAPLVAAMAVGPLLAWKRADLAAALSRLWLAALATLAAILTVWLVHGLRDLVGIVGMAMAAWLFVGALSELAVRIKLFAVPLSESARRLANLPRAAWGMSLAHAGLAVAIAGMTGAGVWKQESVQLMTPGQTLSFAGYDITLDAVQPVAGPNYEATRGSFTLERDGRKRATMTPEKRFYPVEGRQTTEAAIRTTVSGDIYLVIGDRQGDGGYVTRFYFNPLVVWIWAGAAFMVAGGLLSLSDRRHRIGAPSRKAARAPGVTPIGTAGART
ncbi:MAG: heme lyase CcmF/NrfE family subunit [Rhodospirillales bacterium]|nr:heme lyase CcmF/NrfE family subunit [Rhodospirillales bacterium]